MIDVNITEYIPTLEQMLEYTKSQFLKNDFLVGFLVTGIVGGLSYSLRKFPKEAYEFFLSKFTTRLTIASDDDMFEYFKRWISMHDFSKLNKNFRVISHVKTSLGSVTMPTSSPFDDDDDESMVGATKKPKFSATASSSRYFFFYNKKILSVSCSEPEPVSGSSNNNGRHNVHEVLHIRYFGRSNKTANKIFEDVSGIYDVDKAKAIMVKCPNTWGHWYTVNELSVKKLDSVVNKVGVTEKLVKDMEKFIRSRDWYIDKGVPYHRGYLFYGSPGVGKTSTAHVLASHFKKSVHCATINKSMTDESFSTLISRVPPGEILVIEEIDCVYKGDRESKDSGVSFATFINAIDGFGARDGAIIIMTTNHVDKLDPALVRPGRIDVKVEFTPCDKHQLVGLFNKFYPGNKDLAERFSNAVAQGKYSPAQLQGYFMNNETAREAIDNIGDIPST